MTYRKKIASIIFILGCVYGVFYLYTQNSSDTSPSETSNSDAVVEPATEEVDQPSTIREFSADEFKEAYDNLSLPNIIPIVSPPEITGNKSADEVIQAAAESRGYSLRDVSSGLLNTTDGIKVQELLIQSWQDLKNAAANDGHTINVYSGYRSIKEQNQVFTERLFATGVTIDDILSGDATDQIDAVLQVTAPPGYSRHHSGYTIDIEDPDYFVFAESPAYTWLSEDNFRNAKVHGFIPSYPDGATNQGPNPEPWEYVWVGPTVTYN